MFMLSQLAQTAYPYSSAAPAVHGSGLQSEDVMILVLILSSLVFGVLITAIVLPIHANTKNRKEREQTKREIAAYVAEGSIPPGEGTKMIEAAERGGRCTPRPRA